MLNSYSESMKEAENSMHCLVELVESLVESNTDLRNRLDDIAADHASAYVNTRPSSFLPSSTSITAPTILPREFEEDLNRSRVYRKVRPRDSIYSINSSQRASLTSSAFSELSLGDVSIVSVLCLPVWSVDLGNAEYYRFGREGLTLTIAELAVRYPDINFSDPDSLDDDLLENLEHESVYHDSNNKSDRRGLRDPKDAEPLVTVHSPSNSLSTSGIFNSALPIHEYTSLTEVPQHETQLEEPEVLFVAASLFEFQVSTTKKEGGIPYLIYAPGEVSTLQISRSSSL